MGASSSICDLQDLQKEFQALAPTLTDEQKQSLNDAYKEAESKQKGELYVIGCCRKKLADLQSGAAPAPAAESGAEAGDFVVREVKVVGGTGELEKAVGVDLQTGAAPPPSGIDRSGIEKNASGCDEPSSADPELWNIDGCEVDMLVKYKMGGNLWYVQSRMRENPPQKPIPGFPLNQKATDASRYYAKEDEGEFNKDSTNFCDGAAWKAIQEANPPVAAAA
jgi:hypothetical protein